MYVVQDFRFITLFMMMQMIVGAIVMPFAPKAMEKFGKKKLLHFALIIQAVGLLMMVFGPYKNIPYLFVCHIVYGLGYLSGPCGSVMLVDALDEMDLRTGVRTDGTAFALNGLGSKIGSAIGSALGVAIIGWFGYVGGGEITQHVQNDIIVATNIVPAIIFLIGIIPVALYSLKESDMVGIREALRVRNEQREKEYAEKGVEAEKA